ncbi:hypothetical protein [Legionella hackeliae]|uniref:Uncharacterized protein n=1 Tax=Legionella hackeliae TaxID=449 RepID=A0A0A8ULN4_LEGHA|nr:hypothetical protein [Legionella hackeliae]KTD10119.1 hypothetical protein Lhac_2487 [Legionella hackeliae]CEK09608.1 protein of unknown function [Legionella hackeliae]STX49523.1 Uncharacterised protein [Legionella hackeliae]
MSKFMKLVVTGESAGIVEVTIDNTSSDLTATFTYTPDSKIPMPKEMVFGYVDGLGKTHVLAMIKKENGQWTSMRTMAPNESSDFFMHPNVKPGEMLQKPNINHKITLVEGKIVTSYQNSEDIIHDENDVNTWVSALRDLQVKSIPKTESGAIDLTKAEHIAEGGTHVLYRFPNAPFVIKLMKHNPDPKELEELEKKYAVLYDCFDRDGKKRCIREQHVTLPVLLPGKKIQNAALSIVPYQKCFKSKVKFDFKMEPAELDPYLINHNKGLFDRANKALIYHDGSQYSFNLSDYVNIDERIGGILQRLDSDAQLREVMSEFLNHYREFYQKTNIILDTVGLENILFFKDEQGDWQFKIGSAIKHDTGKYTNELFTAMHAGNEVNLSIFFNFTHAYFSPANIRAANACAMKLGLAPVINDVIIHSQELFKIAQELSIGERMLAYARHGDFETVNEILQANKDHVNFNLRDFWAYPMIADEYIKQGQSPQNYLKTVSQFPVLLPEDEDDAKRVQGAKINITARLDVHNKKILLHKELQFFFFSHKQSQETTAKNDNSLSPETEFQQI